ncbi:MAG: hypothetical protein PHX43_08790 [Alphaproteobacteria bacterium]|nr:hypothetical protein [Alphaproteobacteria bacterium]
MRNTVVNVLEALPTTISSGQSLSPALNLGGLRLFGIAMPAAWTTANLTFQVSSDGGSTWNNMYDANGNEVSVIAAASRFIALDPMNFASIQMLKVRSGTSSTPVNQGQDSSLSLMLRTI